MIRLIVFNYKHLIKCRKIIREKDLIAVKDPIKPEEERKKILLISKDLIKTLPSHDAELIKSNTSGEYQSPLKSDSIIRKMLNVFSAKSLRIYPNPVVRGGTFNFQTQVNKPGVYLLQLSDVNGKVIFSKINIYFSRVNEPVLCSESIAPGNYIISLVDTGSKVIQTAKIVVL